MTDTYNFKYSTQVIRPEGKMVYEYNPLYNYRLDHELYLKDKEGKYLSADRTILDYAFPVSDTLVFNGESYTTPEDENINEFVRNHPDLNWKNGYGYTFDKNGNKKYYPLVKEEDGIISDLITEGKDGLNFDLTHPVNILCLQSYDGSTNLILNDNKNIPRIINTRFTPTENNTYVRVDRKGNTDTNLYDQDEFESDSSLNKRSKTIPLVKFKGLEYGGLLQVGMYHCYFKLCDADGNESDFVGETFGIPVYIGAINYPATIRGGLANERTDKSFRIVLERIDSAYDYVIVYYTRTSGMSQVDPLTEAYKIEQRYRIINNKCEINVTGFESTTQLPVGDLLIEHLIIDRAKAQTICQNMLMLGNVSKSTVNYEQMQKLSLNFLPFYVANSSADLIGVVDFSYTGGSKSGYYNANNVYNYTGYWPEEMYRFGVVYVMKDGSTSPVFNIRGIGELPNLLDISVLATNDLEDKTLSDRVFSPYYADETEGIEAYRTAALNNPYTNPKSSKFVVDYDTCIINANTLENSAGVVKFPNVQTCESNINSVDNPEDTKKIHADLAILSLYIKVSDETILELKSLGIKGYFIVRQKRIPTIIAQAMTEGFEKNSGTPVLYDKWGSYYVASSWTDNFTKNEKNCIDRYFTETFIKPDATLPNDDITPEPELITFPWGYAEDSKPRLESPSDSVLSAFCPEFELNQGRFNALFTGGNFSVKNVTEQQEIVSDEDNYGRHWHCAWSGCLHPAESTYLSNCNIVSIPDGTPLIRTGGITFRGRCGNAEDLSYVSVASAAMTKDHLPTADNFETLKKRSRKRLMKALKITALAVAVAATVVASIYTCGGASAALPAEGAALAATVAGTVASSAAAMAIASAVSAAAIGIASAIPDDVPKPIDGTYEQNAFIIRGIFGPYLGLYNNTTLKPGLLINIYYPQTETMSELDKFKIRFTDSSPYYTVSRRIEIQEPFHVKSGANDSIFSVFNGDCYINTFTHRVIRNFSDPEAPTNDLIVNTNTWKEGWKGLTDNAEVNRGDINAVKLGLWFTFLVRSSANLYYRDTDPNNAGEESLFGKKRSFYPLSDLDISGSSKISDSFCYNNGFSKSVGDKLYTLLPNVPYIKNIFLTRIAFSVPSLTDSFRNGFREFLMTAYKDYPIQYGGITSLQTVGKDLMIIFEHGIGHVSVNLERLLKSDTVEIAVGASEVLGEILMISDKFGTQWPESVCKTDKYVYGLDTVAKKIWRVPTSGYSAGTIEIISDLTVLSFLVNNITLSERELTPVIGVRNVKTHYNANKHDVMFTYYDNLDGFEEKAWNLNFNEDLKCFTTFYSWIPSYSANVYNQFFTYDRNSSKWISKLGLSLKDTPDVSGVCVDNINIDLWLA